MNGSQKHIYPDLAPSPDSSRTPPALIYDWFRDQFPVWREDMSPDYPGTSQSLTQAKIPEAVQGPAGIVYFKSVSDPVWSPEDLASLRESFPWILLVLNPSEGFYELDPVLDTLSKKSSRLVIWRPDRPTPQEAALLRLSVLDGTISRSESHGGPGDGARRILSALYVSRGVLIVQGVRRSIARDLGDSDLQCYLSACLMSLAPSVQSRSAPPVQETDKSALLLASILCGQDCSVLDSAAAEGRVLAWASEHLGVEHGILSGKAPSLPEPFLTTRFADEARAFDAALLRIQHTLLSLRRDEVRFGPAMAQISQIFQGDEARLLHWKGLVEDFPGFLHWLPAFERASEYLCSSFPTHEETIETRRTSLLAAIAQPTGFLEAKERARFDCIFEEFKEKYIDNYVSLHEDTVHILGNLVKLRAKVDSVALRNLELLSELPQADKTYLNRVRAIGKYVQANQCTLPARVILARQPRCCCSLHPEAARQLAGSVDQMSQAIRRGISHFRMILRKCRIVIISELKTLDADDRCARQIAALLSRGPMIALKRQTIDILAEIMQKHARAFRAAAGLPMPALEIQTSDLGPQPPDPRNREACQPNSVEP
jgi:hypothetical protein